MQIGDQTNNCKVVFVRGKYYITEIGRSMDDQKLYRVYVDSNYWRDQKNPKFVSVYLDHAIEWIANRKCFKNEKEDFSNA